MDMESRHVMDSVSIFHSGFQFQGNAELKKKKFQKLVIKCWNAHTSDPERENRILPITPENALSTFTSRLHKVKKKKKSERNQYLLILCYIPGTDIL